MKLVLTLDKDGVEVSKVIRISRNSLQIENEEQWEAYLVDLIQSCFPQMKVECIYEVAN